MEQQAKERILTAAKHVFSEKGFDGARMGEIARAAKVNQAMLHYYFQSKEHLYEEVLHNFFAVKQVSSFVSLVNKFDLTPSQRLYLEIYVMIYLNNQPVNQDFERILYMLISGVGIKKFMSITKKFYFPVLQLLENTIRAGIEKGEFESHDPIMSAIEISIFTTHFNGRSRFFEGTKWNEHINKEIGIKEIFDFFIRYTFKGLSPAGREFSIPVIPENIMSEVDNTIGLILKEVKRGFNE